MGTLSGNCPDLFVFRENTKIIFDQKFILLERLCDFYDDGFAGHPMADESYERVDQQETAEDEEQPATKRMPWIYLIIHWQVE